MNQYPIRRNFASYLIDEIESDIRNSIVDDDDEVRIARSIVAKLRTGKTANYPKPEWMSVELVEGEISWLWLYCSDFMDAWFRNA